MMAVKRASSMRQTLVQARQGRGKAAVASVAGVQAHVRISCHRRMGGARRFAGGSRDG